MRLLLLRHAIAIPRGTPGIPDGERPLTPKGEKRFREAAKGLARLTRRPDAILTSPLTRARETAVLAAKTWRGPDPRPEPALASGEIEPLAAALVALKEADLVVLVGHEPHMSRLIATILGSRESRRLTFRKGGAALIEIDGSLEGGGSLIWFLPPRILRTLARG